MECLGLPLVFGPARRTLIPGAIPAEGRMRLMAFPRLILALAGLSLAAAAVILTARKVAQAGAQRVGRIH